MHKWSNRRYSHDDCGDDDTVYQSYGALYLHQTTAHDDSWEETCPAVGCNRGNKPFITPANQRDHIKRKHPELDSDLLAPNKGTKGGVTSARSSA